MAKVVPMDRKDKKPTQAEQIEQLTNQNTELQQYLQGQAQEIRDCHEQVGALTIKNTRQERMIQELAQRLSKYEPLDQAPQEVDDESA